MKPVVSGPKKAVSAFERFVTPPCGMEKLE